MSATGGANDPALRVSVNKVIRDQDLRADRHALITALSR